MTSVCLQCVASGTDRWILRFIIVGHDIFFCSIRAWLRHGDGMYIAATCITKKTVARAESLSATVFASFRGMPAASESVYGSLRLVHGFGGRCLVKLLLVECRQYVFYILQH